MNIEVPQEDKPSRKVRFHKTGLDYVVSWSVVGLFAIFALISLHLASFVLIPLTMAIVVGLILGLAADRLGNLGVPPTLTAIILSSLFLVIILFLVSIVWTPVNMLIENGPDMINRTVEYLQQIPWLERPMAALSRGPDSMEAMLQNSGTILSTVATGVGPALVQLFIFIAGLLLFLSTQLFGHARDEESDQRGRQRETQPHAVNLQRRPLEGWQGERVVPDQHQRVTQQRQAGKHDGIKPRQGCRSDGQRHQVVGHERIGRAAGVVQQRAVDHQVAAQMHGVFQLGDGPRAAQTQCRTQTEHRRHGQRDAQRQPRQRQHLRRVSHAHGAGLCSQHHDANKGQKPKVLPAGR